MKKILFMCVGVLLAFACIGGTIAMAAEAGSGSGVSNGQVNIRLMQEQRGASGLENFVFSNLVDSSVMIYPSYIYDMSRKTETYDIGEKNYSFWSNSEVMGATDHIVRVKNAFAFTSDAYVRVFFAFEGGADKVLLNRNEEDWTWELVAKNVQINRENASYNGTYDIYVATYNKVLTENAITEPCLLQIALDGKNADLDFFEAVGDTYETLVYAQALRSSDFATDEEGFATAFGSMTEDPNTFFSKIDWAASSAYEEKN